MLSEEEKARRWKELICNEGVVVESKEKGVRREEKGGWRGELVSDLKGFVILLVFWVLFGLFMEFV